MTTHAELHELLKRNGKPVPSRKIANNTYAIRDWPHSGDIHIRFHDTNVVTHHIDGTITLDSGGWYTQATCDRINRFVPEGISVYSVKGRWYVRHRGGFSSEGRQLYPPTSPFTDGIRFAPVKGTTNWVAANGLHPDEQQRQDAHNARVEKLIDGYMRWLTLERYDQLFRDGNNGMRAGYDDGCGMCVRTDVGKLVGDEFEDKQHLIEHLIDKSVPFNVFHVACDHAMGGHDGLMRCQHYDIAKRDLRKWLRQQLYVGPVAIKGGKRPPHSEPWSLTARMRRKPA